MTGAFAMDGEWYSFGDRGYLKLEVDFGDGVENLTYWWQGLQRVSGRRSPLDRFNASTLTFELENGNRDFSPWRTGAYGRPVRNMPVRVTAKTAAGLEIIRFTGWTTKWTEMTTPYPSSSKVAVSRVQVTATDGFKRLSLANGLAQVPAGEGELTGERMHRILDAAGWEADLRYIDPGVVTFADTDLSRPALDELHDAALADGGVFFISQAGVATFYDRSSMDASLDPVALFGNDGGGGSVPYGELAVSSTDEAIKNTVRVARTGGTSYTAVDAPSVAQDGQQLFIRTDLALELDSDAEDLAAVLLARADNAEFVVGPIQVQPISKGDEAWRAVVDLKVTNPVSLAHGDIDTGGGFTMLARIDGVTDNITPGSWITSYSISALDEPDAYEVIGPPTNLVGTPTYDSITWTWDIPVHGFDTIWVNFDGFGWVELDGATDTYWTGGLEPGSSHTLCVRGRKGLIDTDSICETVETIDTPGPPDEPDGGTDVPPPGTGCEWRWVLSEYYEAGNIEVDSGTLTTMYVGWIPDYEFTPDQWYEMCWTKWCGEPLAQVGGELCHRWQEPTGWVEPCEFDDWPGTPVPVFALEVCAATDEIRDIITDTHIFRRELFETATPGPLETDTGVLAGSGFTPAPIGSAYLGDTATMGVITTGPFGLPLIYPGVTLGLWVNFDSEPLATFPLLMLGGADEFKLEAFADTSEVGVVRFQVSVKHPGGTGSVYTFDSAAGTADQVAIAGWHSVAVTFGVEADDDTNLRLYIDGLPTGTVHPLTGNWTVRAHDSLVTWSGEPNSKFAHPVGFDVVLTAEEVCDIFCPPEVADYDTVVLADGPDAYWPLNEKVDAGPGSAYDVRVLADLPVAYWPLNEKTTLVLPEYDTVVMADLPTAYWPLDQIDTV